MRENQIRGQISVGLDSIHRVLHDTVFRMFDLRIPGIVDLNQLIIKWDLKLWKTNMGTNFEPFWYSSNFFKKVENRAKKFSRF